MAAAIVLIYAATKLTKNRGWQPNNKHLWFSTQVVSLSDNVRGRVPYWYSFVAEAALGSGAIRGVPKPRQQSTLLQCLLLQRSKK